MNFLNVSVITPNLKLGNPLFNASVILNEIKNSKACITIFPELALTGSTCGDLFLQSSFLRDTTKALEFIVDNCEKTAVIGTAYYENGKLFNAAVVINNKKIVSIFKKRTVNNRYFTPFYDENIPVVVNNRTLYVEIGEDIYNFNSPVVDIVVNINALPNSILDICIGTSKRFSQVYAICSAGFYESTTDYAWQGENGIYENGEFLGFTNSVCFLSRPKPFQEAQKITLETPSKFFRKIDKSPFLLDIDANKILKNAALSVKRRLEHVNVKKVVIGLSGGLDSTMTLLIAKEVINPKDIITISMPGFGTGSKTKKSALYLAEIIGTDHREIDIKKSVKLHLDEINHKGDFDVTFENAQARERTQILMDVSNMENAILLGTGDLSESALGFATFAGDHISMYNPNASLPKTVIRYLIKEISLSNDTNEKLKEVLNDVLETKISPELVENQFTEDIVGPYLLNDFFLYYLLRFNLGKEEILFLAKQVKEFEGENLEERIDSFFDRFYKSQYKRSVATDGPQLLCVSLSPRGSFVFPSDIKEYNK